MDHEFRLLEKLQKADSRNFHAWNYRRFIAALQNRSEEDELKFTTDMINTNFSNYSAWHNRSVLLSHLIEKKAQGFCPKEKVLTEEFELIHQALFTDPDDQSGWFYHLWLINLTIQPDYCLLISSWPSNGADVIISSDINFDCLDLSPFTCSHSDTGTFPLVLYFNQAVKGVNSSTITVDTVLNTNENLTWHPVSTNNSGTAVAWVTHLSLPDLKAGSLRDYPVKVSLGKSPGIVSSNGFQCSVPFQIEFRFRVQNLVEEVKKGLDVEMIVWRDENYQMEDKDLQDSGAIVSLDHLSINSNTEPAASSWVEQIIANEIELFRELLTEINCKIGKLTLARLLRATSAYATIPIEEVLKLYSELMKLDPSHLQYYKDEHSLVLMKKVTSSKESLLRHCWRYKNLKFPSVDNPICLRLNNLSLSRIGSVEHLLWVQMLDLSHNELQSIEGLETMQLLSRLNLSRNKLSSFSALEPLRLLKSLKVLDISFNEIGDHSIDTRRYLFSSPLCHSVRKNLNGDDFATAGKYWEAFLIFKGMNLIQFDVVGNSIMNGNFRSFLRKFLPSLKWLDGEELH